MNLLSSWTVFDPYCFLRISSNIVFTLLLQKEEHIQFCIDILKYRILISSLSITLYFRNYLTQYFSIALHFYPHQKNKSRYVQNQTQNEISFRRSVFYLNFLSKYAKCFLKRRMFTQNVQGSHFFFPWKCTDQVTSSECMYSWNALRKITSKISGNVGNINEPCSVLNASFHLNGKPMMSAFDIAIEKTSVSSQIIATASLDCETSLACTKSLVSASL